MTLRTALLGTLFAVGLVASPPAPAQPKSELRTRLIELVTAPRDAYFQHLSEVPREQDRIQAELRRLQESRELKTCRKRFRTRAGRQACERVDQRLEELLAIEERQLREVDQLLARNLAELKAVRAREADPALREIIFWHPEKVVSMLAFTASSEGVGLASWKLETLTRLESACPAEKSRAGRECVIRFWIEQFALKRADRESERLRQEMLDFYLEQTDHAIQAVRDWIPASDQN